jgi:hypothetical protein
MGNEEANRIINRHAGMNIKRFVCVLLGALLLFASAACFNTSIASAPSLQTEISAVESNPETGETGNADAPVFNTQPQSTPAASPQNTAESNDNPPVEPLSILNEEYAAYGSMTIEGMKGSDYDNAMSIEWTQVDTPGEPVPYDIDISELMDYTAIEQYILNLGRYDGVDIYVIGKSGMGRNIYMVSLNLSGEADTDRPLIMMTGNVHAREFAGADYMVKFLNDTLIKAQTDAYTRALLQSVAISAIPLVNPDGRELIIEGGNRNRKSNANGVDLNRAMPSVNAGQLASGVKRVKNFSKKPGMDFFAGYSLGTESETQAMIKWFNVCVPQAAAYIDLHQQGGSMYYNKPFASKSSDAACLAFAKKINTLLKKGYKPNGERKKYGMNGDGGTMTDYARSVSEGFVFSYRLGRMALLMNGVETPLLCFGDLDRCMEYYQPVNAGFLCATIEIGRSPSYLGAKAKACSRREKEYNKYGWKNFLTGTVEIVLGEEKVNEIKSGI